jgi:hypothetical protein
MKVKFVCLFMLMSAKRAVGVCNNWESKCEDLRLQCEKVLLPIRLNILPGTHELKDAMLQTACRSSNKHPATEYVDEIFLCVFLKRLIPVATRCKAQIAASRFLEFRV